MGRIKPYIQIARPDHWFKNVFMIPGIVLAFLFTEITPDLNLFINIITGIIAACLIASANYTINEVLDAPYDKEHPVKKNRPVPSGQVNIKFAYVQYFLLVIAGLAVSYSLNIMFLLSGVLLLVMGLIYNVSPVRSKDLMYFDVLSESINNPIRLLLGWFSITAVILPPLSIIIAYWMIGAFFMAAKRLGEIRFINNNETVKVYRKSLAGYTQEKLLYSIFFYASAFSFTSAIFLIRYKFELILLIPILAILIAEYLRISFLHDSPVQYPEKLYKQTRLVIYCILLLVAFVILIFIKLPWLAKLFDPQIHIGI